MPKPRIVQNVVDTAKRVAATVRHRERNTGRVERRRQPNNRPVDPGTRIEYTPQLDGDPDPGEVVWTWVPFEEDPTLGKDRPVVIIGRHGDSLSGVALTSRDKDRADHVEIGSGAWDPQGRPSYAKVDRLIDIDPDDVRREGAILNRRRFDDVVDEVSKRHDVRRN